MKDKLITTTKRERDSEGSIVMASYLAHCGESGKSSYEYQKNLRELFFEYRSEGLKPREALEKAKRVLSSFET
jgi:hypothetical protein